MWENSNRLKWKFTWIVIKLKAPLRAFSSLIYVGTRPRPIDCTNECYHKGTVQHFLSLPALNIMTLNAFINFCLILCDFFNFPRFANTQLPLSIHIPLREKIFKVFKQKKIKLLDARQKKLREQCQKSTITIGMDVRIHTQHEN